MTPREHKVLVLMTQGNPNKVMAYELSVSPRTVEIHRARPPRSPVGRFNRSSH
ncbi:MAG: LuxR C-terminal-related transcriptional regulator [Steroidobacteraceae bacterium]